MRKLHQLAIGAASYAHKHTCTNRAACYMTRRPHSELVQASRDGSHTKLPDYEFEIIGEEQIYKRYLALSSRRIRLPATDTRPAVVHEYDIVGHPQCDNYFAVTFPFHSDSSSGSGGQVTLLREFCQGPNQMMFVLPTGGRNPKQHSTPLACAQAELSEEAQLRGGEWQALIEPGHPGIAEVKWCANRFTPFLCIDPEEDKTPGTRDVEEFIEIHRISVADLQRIMVSGEMLLPSVSTCFLALERLKGLKLLPI